MMVPTDGAELEVAVDREIDVERPVSESLRLGAPRDELAWIVAQRSGLEVPHRLPQIGEPPPTYEELLATVAKLEAYALHLEDAVRAFNTAVALRDAEIQRLTLKAGKKPARVLDPKAASAFDRPYDGR